MPTEPRREPGPPKRDAFTHRGRPFVRMSLPGAHADAPPFAVAQPLADRYQVGELVSVGEFGVVLRGHDPRTRRDVIIKALRSDAIRIPPPDDALPEAWAGEIRRLRHLLQAERRLLVHLRNAGCRVVPLPVDYAYDRNPVWEGGQPPLDDALAESEPYLVLEHIPGPSLEELLAKNFPRGMPEADALRLIFPVVEALAVLHRPWTLRNGRTWHCVYQDLKPANLLVEPSGSPRLIDFGGCQIVVDGVPVLEGSHTPGYEAPECVGSTGVLLPSADVYGIGTTLVHMLSGIDPRDRRPGTRPDAGLPGRTSTGVRDLLARCLASRPSDRLADATAVAAAITPLLDHGRTRRLAPSP